VVSRGKVSVARERVQKNPVMTFPIKKRTSTELFNDRMAALYKGKIRIRVVTNIPCAEMLF